MYLKWPLSSGLAPISNTGAVTGLTVGPHETLSKETSASMKHLNILHGGTQNEQSGEVILHTEQTYLKKNPDLFTRRPSDTAFCTERSTDTDVPLTNTQALH